MSGPVCPERDSTGRGEGSTTSPWFDEVFRDRVRFGLRVRRFVYSGASDFQRIDVFDTEQFGRVLALDGIYQTSEGDEHYYHEMLVHPAMTTAPTIRRVLVIGGGDGGTVREVLRYPEVERVCMVEIDRKVVEVCREYLPGIGTAWDDPRLEVRFEDGVRYVREADAAYDVILLDGSDPVGPAKGLFDEEFYHGCARLLDGSGVLGVQSESPVLFRETFVEVVRTLRRVLERAHPYFGSVPIYGAGLWAWTHASRTVNALEPIPHRLEHIERFTRHYNGDVHRGAFALPNELRRELD